MEKVLQIVINVFEFVRAAWNELISILQSNTYTYTETNGTGKHTQTNAFFNNFRLFMSSTFQIAPKTSMDLLLFNSTKNHSDLKILTIFPVFWDENGKFVPKLFANTPRHENIHVWRDYSLAGPFLFWSAPFKSVAMSSIDRFSGLLSNVIKFF